MLEKKYGQKCWDFIKLFLLPIFIIFGIYWLGISAILRANFNYIDDMGRVFAGYRGWSNFSRYLSSGLSIFLHTDSYLMDISPLPQLLAILFLSISTLIVLYVVTKKKKYTVLEYLSTIFLGLNPYFLECLSYKYDAPYMALSILVSVFPLIFYNKKKMLYGLSCFFSAIFVCTTYQVSAGILPMVVLFLSFKNWMSKESLKKIVSFLGISILSYGTGLLFFQKFLMFPVSTYVSTEVASVSNLFPTIINNYVQYFSLINSDFKKEWLVFLAGIVLVAIIQMIKSSKQNKFLTGVLSIVLVCFMALLSFGIYPILIRPLFSPRAMYGFGIFIFFLVIEIVTGGRNYLGKFFVVSLAWMFFVFSFSYGNYLFVQKTYTDFRIKQTINDLNDLNLLSGKEIQVQIVGSIGLAPALKNVPQDFQMLKRLVPITFRDSRDSWAVYGFDNYYNLTNVVLASEELTSMNLPILKENIYETIRGRNSYILIELKE